MKKILAFLKLFLFVSICTAQTVEVSPYKWSSMIDTSAFDGVSRVAFIIGTSDNPRACSPMLAINKTDGEEIKAILSYWPGNTSLNSMLYVKFDNEQIYTLKAMYIPGLKIYVMDFNPYSDMNIIMFMHKIKNCKILHMRLSSVYLTMSVDFKLDGASEALEVLDFHPVKK
jgi:hypothetical protein